MLPSCPPAAPESVVREPAFPVVPCTVETGQECLECPVVGRKGYCARGRCLCGHESCWAFMSWRPLAAIDPPLGRCPNGMPYAADGGCCGEDHP